MVHLVNVGPRFGHDGGNERQRARHVARAHRHARQAASADHTPFDNGRQQHRVDVSAAQHQTDLPTTEALGVFQQCGNSSRPRAFDQALFDLQEHDDGPLDISLIHQHDIVDMLFDQSPCHVARCADRDALGDRRAALWQRRVLHRIEHAGKPHHLHTDDLDGRLQCLGRHRDPCDQATAANGDHQSVEVRLRFEHLDPDRALACDNGLVIVRMDESQLLAFGQCQGMITRLVEGVAMQNDLGAKASGSLDLDPRGEPRHHEHGAQTQALGVVGHGLSMVAGAHCHHACHSPAFHAMVGRCQRSQFVARATFLEGSGELQVLELEEYPGPGQL